MSDTIFLKAMDNGGYFILIIWIWYILYLLWKMFINWYLKLEADKNNMQLKIETEKAESFTNSMKSIVEYTKEIVNTLNTQYLNSDNTHKIIIKKIDDTHNDVKYIKDNIWKK